jgi:hypothetical protein
MTVKLAIFLLGLLLLSVIIALISPKLRKLLLLLVAFALFAFGVIALWPPIVGISCGRAPAAMSGCEAFGLIWTVMGVIPTIAVFLFSLALLANENWRWVARASALLCFIPLAGLVYGSIEATNSQKTKDAYWNPYCKVLENNHNYFALYLQKLARERPQDFLSDIPHGTINHDDFWTFCKATKGCNADDKDLGKMALHPVEYTLGYQVMDGVPVLDITSYPCHVSRSYDIEIIPDQKQRARRFSRVLPPE